LFPHLTVEGNVAFGLKQEGLPKAEIATRVADMLALVKLETFGLRKPHQLSGGQRQRVALARSLVKRPRVLLLDEPMAALDKKLRGETQFELMDLQRSLGLTFVIVTHDQSEAMTVADRIAVMDRGRLMQVGPPAEIYEQPDSRWVADFIGSVNLLEGRVGEAGDTIEGTAFGRIRVGAKVAAEPHATVWVAVRPEKIRLARCEAGAEQRADTENSAVATVVDVGYLGDLSLFKLRTECGVPLQAAIANTGPLTARGIGWNEKVWLSFAPEATIVLTR
jgi:putrescine transport system ATP-binding protein